MFEHPVIVHFPIALLSVVIFTELMSYFWQKEFFVKATLFLLIVGCVTAVLSLYSGENAADAVNGWREVEGLLEQHEQNAKLSLLFYLIGLAIKLTLHFKKQSRHKLRMAAIPFLLLGMLFLHQTGVLGGKLVYEKGVGVKPVMEKFIPAP